MKAKWTSGWSTLWTEYVAITSYCDEYISQEGHLQYYASDLILAVRITNEYPEYALYDNNCQNFAKYLVESITVRSLSSETIEESISRWLNALVPPRFVTLRTTPGYSPTATSMSFHTASEISVYTASESIWFSAVESIQANSILSDVDCDILTVDDIHCRIRCIDIEIIDICKRIEEIERQKVFHYQSIQAMGTLLLNHEYPLQRNKHRRRR